MIEWVLSSAVLIFPQVRRMYISSGVPVITMRTHHNILPTSSPVAICQLLLCFDTLSLYILWQILHCSSAVVWMSRLPLPWIYTFLQTAYIWSCVPNCPCSWSPSLRIKSWNELYYTKLNYNCLTQVEGGKRLKKNLIPDSLHPSPEGIETLAKCIRPILKQYGVITAGDRKTMQNL